VTLPDRLGPGLRVVIAGTVRAGCARGHGHYHDGPGNQFWRLLYESGLVAEHLEPTDDARLPALGVGLTDVVGTVIEAAGTEPFVRWEVDDFRAKIVRCRPRAVAFVSKTAAAAYARGARERPPRDYGALSWDVGGVPAFVLPGPSGANNGMPLPLRIALWRDLADFLETL
jgi:TDG/mug DNA glycosylase family protein